MCNAYMKIDFVEGLQVSVNEDYRKLSTRSLVYGENLSRRRRGILERKCGLHAFLITRNYVTYNEESDDDDDLLSTLRIMENCVNTFYSAFAFQKYSPYTKLFNWHIRRYYHYDLCWFFSVTVNILSYRYQEYGIIQKWYADISREQNGLKNTFEDDYPENDSQRQINLVNVSGAFFLLFAGLVLSVISFSFELIKFKRDETKRVFTMLSWNDWIK